MTTELFFLPPVTPQISGGQLREFSVCRLCAGHLHFGSRLKCSASLTLASRVPDAKVQKLWRLFRVRPRVFLKRRNGCNLAHSPRKYLGVSFLGTPKMGGFLFRVALKTHSKRSSNSKERHPTGASSNMSPVFCSLKSDGCSPMGGDIGSQAS